MVSEAEKEELGRLTLRNLKAPPHEPAGRLTHQNLQSLKGAQKKTETQGAKVTALLDKFRRAVTTGLSALFTPRLNREGDDPCETFGHNWVSGTSWEGLHPKCLDCGKPITDASELRGSLAKSERHKARR